MVSSVGSAQKKTDEDPSVEMDRWIESIGRRLRRIAETGGYGTLEIELFGGHIKRVGMRRTAVRPEQLADDE